MAAKAKPVAREMTIPLSAETRRQRVEAVRALDKDLRRVESALADACARLPGLLHDVRAIRATIEENTAPPKGEATTLDAPDAETGADHG